MDRWARRPVPVAISKLSPGRQWGEDDSAGPPNLAALLPVGLIAATSWRSPGRQRLQGYPPYWAVGLLLKTWLGLTPREMFGVTRRRGGANPIM